MKINHIQYRRVYLTKKQHNQLFPKAKRHWTKRHVYCFSEKAFLVRRFQSFKLILLCWLALPLLLVWYGPSSWKELIEEYVAYMNQEGNGLYSDDVIWSSYDRYQPIRAIVTANELR